MSLKNMGSCHVLPFYVILTKNSTFIYDIQLSLALIHALNLGREIPFPSLLTNGMKAMRLLHEKPT